MQYFYGLLYLLTVHFVADFVLQSDWMAQNKSKSNMALGTHIAIYTVVLFFGAFPLMVIIRPSGDLIVLGWIVLNGAAHFATDYITSRITARLYENHRHYFYVIIGFDQLIHAWTLGLTMVWLLK